jgi:hypothetical protein
MYLKFGLFSRPKLVDAISDFGLVNLWSIVEMLANKYCFSGRSGSSIVWQGGRHLLAVLKHTQWSVWQAVSYEHL